MLKFTYEFRKGILFVRFYGSLVKENYLSIKLDEIIDNFGINKIVFNICDVLAIDAFCIDALLNYNKDRLVMICDKGNSFDSKFKNKLRIISSEIDAFSCL